MNLAMRLINDPVKLLRGSRGIFARMATESGVWCAWQSASSKAPMLAEWGNNLPAPFHILWGAVSLIPFLSDNPGLTFRD